MRADVERAVAAIRSGGVVVIPTDTVYGLAARADDERAAAAMYAVKGREPNRPTAVVAPSLQVLETLVPELRTEAGSALLGVLPGPFTFVLPNPARRLAWLNPSQPDAIGVRVPSLSGVAADVLSAAGAVAATSANLPGGPDPVELTGVPHEILGRVAIAVDGGRLPGVPSTVIDFTGDTPVVLRHGAGDAPLALAAWSRR